MSESRKGSGNPQFGKKEDELHKKMRMKNFLAKEKWNKGLKGDSRLKGPKGQLPYNAIHCIATHVTSKEVIEDESKSRLIKKMKELGIKISASAVERSMKFNRPTKSGWRFEYASKKK